MKRLMGSISLLTLLTFVLMGTYVFTVPASDAGEATPADIVRGTGCVFFDANGTPFFDASAEFQIVITNNGKGNANARCQGSLPPGAVLPDKAMHFNNANTGFGCLGTDDWKMTVTPSGNGSFTCHVPE